MVFLRKTEAKASALSGRLFISPHRGHDMRKLLFFILLAFRISAVPAQEFDTHWISISRPDSLSHVWFRRTYLFNGRPRQARVTFATTGLVKLYVNECNIGTASFYPLRTQGDNLPVAITLDVTPYLRPDSNVIAAIYAPAYPETNRRQLSVSFYGIDDKGRSFCYNSDNSWLCRRANSAISPKGGEIIDGRFHNPGWKAAWFDAALWTPAACFRGPKALPLVAFEHGYEAPKVRHVRTYERFDTDETGVVQDFYPAFRGFLRLTLRGARRGEHIHFGNVQYICNGELDEQAYPVFSLSSYSAVHISGDRYFKPSQITGLDAVEMGQEAYFDF